MTMMTTHHNSHLTNRQQTLSGFCFLFLFRGVSIFYARCVDETSLIILYHFISALTVNEFFLNIMNTHKGICKSRGIEKWI